MARASKSALSRPVGPEPGGVGAGICLKVASVGNGYLDLYEMRAMRPFCNINISGAVYWIKGTSPCSTSTIRVLRPMRGMNIQRQETWTS